MAFAANTDGVTQRDHLLQVCKQTGKTPEELGFVMPEVPEPPEKALYLWNWFLELSGARTSNGFGPNPLTWHDMNAFFCIIAITPTPWEAQTLRRMDMAYLAAHAKTTKNTPHEQ